MSNWSKKKEYDELEEFRDFIDNALMPNKHDLTCKICTNKYEYKKSEWNEVNHCDLDICIFCWKKYDVGNDFGNIEKAINNNKQNKS